MSTRSPYNDRNKTEQKGKTRKSAAASKPKRDAGAPASASSSKKKPAAKKKTMWGRGPASGPVAPVVQSPEMKKLRRLWWILWGGSLGVALVAYFLGEAMKTNPSIQTVYTVFLGLWAASFAGVLYLEFGPIRKLRIAEIEAAKAAKGKKGKSAKAAAAPEVAPTTDTSEPTDSIAADEKPSALSRLGARFGRSNPAEGVHEVPADASDEASDKDGDA